MTDSSTDKSQKAEPKDKPQPQVPVAAIGAARAEKREAEKSAEEANTKLQGQPDIDAVIAAVTAEAMRAVETRVAPLQERAAKAELALQLGLSPEQVDKVMEVKKANPTLNEQQALLLAKSEHAAIFPTKPAGWNPALHGGLPISGASDARGQSQQIDNVKNMHEAAQRGDRAAATHWATQEALARFKAKFEKDRPQYMHRQ